MAFGLLGSIIGLYIWKDYLSHCYGGEMTEREQIECLEYTIFLFIPSSIALVSALFDKTYLKYLAFLISLPVVHPFIGSGIYPFAYFPSLCYLISALLCYTPPLTKKDKIELERIIIEQAKDIIQDTKERMREAQFQKNTIPAVNPTSPGITSIYQINLKTAHDIKDHYEGYIHSKGLAFANTYRLGIFYILAKTNGIWDLKQTIGEKTIYEFMGTYKTGEYIGNHHYGYMGKAVGLSSRVLKVAGGMYQVYSGTSEWKYIFSYFDDPKDLNAVMDGCLDYDNGYDFQKFPQT